MSKPKSRKYVEDYDSDDGFVEDAPKTKKLKSEPKQKKTVSLETQRDEDGNEYWELSGKRRVQISQFKNMHLIGIREYYEKDGKTVPGKKGIALTIDQYTSLIDILPGIERVLKSKGVSVPRPQYDRKSASKDDEEVEDGNGAADEDEDEEAESSKHKGKLDKYRRNHEATSDEDD